MGAIKAKLGRILVRGLGAVVMLVLSPTPVLRAETELVVAVPGGTYEEGWRKAVIVALEAAHPDIKVRTVQGLTFENLATMRAQKDNVKVDAYS